MKKSGKRRIPAAVLAACLVLVFGSVTAVAAYRYLSPSQMAQRTQDTKLAQAFSGENAILINETQEYAGFRVTLLGIVAGKDLSSFVTQEDDGSIRDDCLYAAVAIEHSDGTPMPDTSDDAYGEECFFVSPYIKGLDPSRYSIMSMGGGYQDFVQDKVLYRLITMDNIEMFADQGIYLGVSSGTFYDSEAYQFDEAGGEIRRNEAYQGLNALFTVPTDLFHADPEAAAAYLKNLQEEWDTPSEPMEMDENDRTVEAFIQKLTENPELFQDPSVVTRVESTVQICKIAEDGTVEASYEYNTDSGSTSGGALNWIDALFPDKQWGVPAIGGYSYSDSGLEDLCIDTWVLNEDGTATFALYVPAR